MDGPGKHYAKWNKPSGERQIPYDVTYKWNLINKTNQQAKYNQRFWNKEQPDRTREEVGRDNGGGEGERFSGTSIKDNGQNQKG